jgi:hypothetical protein
MFLCFFKCPVYCFTHKLDCVCDWDFYECWGLLFWKTLFSSSLRVLDAILGRSVASLLFSSLFMDIAPWCMLSMLWSPPHPSISRFLSRHVSLVHTLIPSFSVLRDTNSVAFRVSGVILSIWNGSIYLVILLIFSDNSGEDKFGSFSGCYMRTGEANERIFCDLLLRWHPKSRHTHYPSWTSIQNCFQQHRRNLALWSRMNEWERRGE